MIDYILKAADEASLITAMAGVNIRTDTTDDSGNAVPGSWRGDISFPCQLSDPNVLDVSDQPTPVAGFFLWVSLPQEDPAISALANVIVIADRDAENRGEPYMIYASEPKPGLYNYIVSPVIAGSDYPFAE